MFACCAGRLVYCTLGIASDATFGRTFRSRSEEGQLESLLAAGLEEGMPGELEIALKPKINITMNY